MKMVVRQIRDVYGARLATAQDRAIFEQLLKMHFEAKWL
jgi:hypothetical protein